MNYSRDRSLVFVLLLAWSHHGIGQVVMQGSFDVTITEVSGYSISFDTGSGMPDATNTVEVYVFDKCKMEGQGQKPVGAFFPFSTVPGIQAEVSSVTNAPGTGTNTLAYKFVEGIEQNTDIFHKEGEGSNTATLAFCVQVGLYIDGYLINWEEVRIHYNIDLTTDMNNQGEPMSFVASASNFEATLEETGLDENSMVGYFCNPNNLKEVEPGTTMRQGSVITTCFEVVDESASRLLQGNSGNGNGKKKNEFEMADIMDLMIKDLGSSQAAQSIIIAKQKANGASYAKKQCRKKSKTTRTCSVSFLLKADFYDYAAAELTGEGAAIVELGEAGRRRRKLVRFSTNNGGPRRLSDAQAVAPTAVGPKPFRVERVDAYNVATSGAANRFCWMDLFWTVAVSFGFFFLE